MRHMITFVQIMLPYSQFWTSKGRLRQKVDASSASDPDHYYEDYLQMLCDVAVLQALDVCSSVVVGRRQVIIGDSSAIIRDKYVAFVESINSTSIVKSLCNVDTSGCPGPLLKSWKKKEIRVADELLETQMIVSIRNFINHKLLCLMLTDD